MKFYPGQKIWAQHSPFGAAPNGEHAGVVVRPIRKSGRLAYEVEIDGIPPPRDYWWTFEEFLRPRDEPPKEKIREEVGEWELCPWKPSPPVTVSDSSGKP